MANFVSNVQVGPYAAESQEVARKRKLAEMLQEQAMSPVSTQGVVSPLHILAKGLQGYKGKQAATEADTKAADLAKRQQEERQTALAAALRQGMGAEQPPAELGGGPAMPPNPAGGMAQLAQSGDPAVMQMGMPPLQAMQAQQKQQQDQAFRAEESAAARQAREQEAALAREARAAEAAQRAQDAQARDAAAREERRLRDQQNADLRREMEAGRRADRAAAGDSTRAFREAQVEAKRGEEFRASKSSLDNATNNLDRLRAEAEKIKKHPGLGRITGLVGAFPDMPGSDAANARALLETLKSQVGFSVLQAMRDASKTGGALGQVSNIENVLLQNNLAALSTAQDAEAMKASLDQIIQYTNSAKQRLTQGFHDSFPEHKPQRRSTDQPAGAGKLTQQEQQELDQLRKRFGR